MLLYPVLVSRHLGVHSIQSLPGTAQPPGDNPGQEDLLLASLDPHQGSPTVALASVLALETPGAEHVVGDGVRRQGLGADGGGHHRDGHLLEPGGQEPSLRGDPPPGHRQGVADPHAGAGQADGAEVVEVGGSLEFPHGDIVVLGERVVLRVLVHALNPVNPHHGVV